MKLYDDYLRWLYRGGHPSRLARMMNGATASVFRLGIWPKRVAALEVQGRATSRTISFPVVIADVDGERYLVSMLGQNTNWVRNVRAADGHAVLLHGVREVVHLDDVASTDRAPILRRYLALAPGARPHIPIDRNAPLDEFARIAADFPVFHISVATDRRIDDTTRDEVSTARRVRT